MKGLSDLNDVIISLSVGIIGFLQSSELLLMKINLSTCKYPGRKVLYMLQVKINFRLNWFQPNLILTFFVLKSF